MRALITGILGQDGSYLAEQLAARGDRVYGLVRSSGPQQLALLRRRVPELAGVRLGDLTDLDSLQRAIAGTAPDVVFNLAAVTTPGEVFPEAPLVAETTGRGAWNVVNAAYQVDRCIKVVHASSSAIYTPLAYGAYGLAKQMAHNAVGLHRESVGMHASNAIFFSHTSSRQSHRFLIRKLVRSAVRLRPGQPLQDPGVMVTNLVNRRDWGWAPDYARALIHVAEAPPGDYTVRTGTTESVEDVLALAALRLGLEPTHFWRCWPQASRVETRLEIEPDEPAPLPPGWAPSVSFKEIIGELVEAELSDQG